ncbi:7726_t:CDS:2 [Paraglomus brasilianum]|uniref:7726_t:CDS:1 n=1 Tax=Paraglomus brasilianum TaxID=144538 RepID=A0A9N9A8E2_9GLOM|nr:7726_t:CDS:2 [Paraglomus brasilianum]
MTSFLLNRICNTNLINPRFTKGLRASSSSASVPFMITSTQRQRLYDLKYTRSDIDSLLPEQALHILSHDLSPESYGAFVRATYRSKKRSVELEVPEVIQLGSVETGLVLTSTREEERQVVERKENTWTIVENVDAGIE